MKKAPSLPRDILADFVRRLVYEPGILRKRTSVKKIFELNQRRLVFTDIDHDVMRAFGALWPTRSKQWFELGTLWLHPIYRNQKQGSILFDKLMHMAPPKSSLFLITRSHRVVHLAKARGWVEVKNWRHSSKWRKVVGYRDYGWYFESKPRMPRHGRLFYYKNAGFFYLTIF